MLFWLAYSAAVSNWTSLLSARSALLPTYQYDYNQSWRRKRIFWYLLSARFHQDLAESNPHTTNFFWSWMTSMVKKDFFLLQCYVINFAPIKRYHQFILKFICSLFNLLINCLFLSLSLIVTTFWSHKEKAYPFNLNFYCYFDPHKQIGLRNLFSITNNFIPNSGLYILGKCCLIPGRTILDFGEAIRRDLGRS